MEGQGDESGRLTRSEEGFRALAEAAGDWLWEVDEQGSFTHVSSKVEDLLGYGPHEVMGKSPFALAPPDDRERAAAGLKSALDARKPFTGLEYDTCHKDGRRVLLQVSGLPNLDVDGNFRGFSAIARDVTEQRQVEGALRESEERYRGLLESVEFGIALISPDMEVLTHNRKMRDWFPGIDVSQHPVCYRTLGREAICEDCPTHKTLEDGQIHETITNTPSGDETIHLRVISSPIKDAEGRVTGAIEVMEDVTARREVERRLLTFRKLMDGTAEAIFVGDPVTMLFVDSNRRATEMLGYSSEELLRMSVPDIEVPGTNGVTWPERLPVMQERGELTYEAGAKCKDGSVLPVEVTVKMMLVERKPFMVAMVRDITERKKTESLLMQKDQALDASLAAIALGDLEGRLAYVNPAFSRLWGHDDPRDLLGRSATDLYQPPEEGSEVLEALRERGLWHGERTGLREDGTAFPVELSASMVTDPSGNPVCTMGWFVDLTERKQVEAQLRSSHDEYRSLASNIPGMVYRAGSDWTTTIVSKTEEISGYSTEELSVGKPSWFEIIYEEDRQRVTTEAAVLPQGLSQLSQEYRIVRKDGAVRWVEDHKKSRWNHAEEFAGVDGIVFDITDRKEAQRALRESKAEIEDQAHQLKETTTMLIQTEKLSALGELAAGVAHEMNQPLNGIKIVCQDILVDIRKQRLREETLEPHLTVVVGLVNRLAAIIDQLRLFVRRPRLSAKDPCDVNDAIEAVLRLVGQQLLDRGFELSKKLNPKLPPVLGDIVQLEQLLMNLVTNARDAVCRFRAEGRRLELRTRLVPDALGPEIGGLVIEVQDNGGGIPASIQDKVFDPFFTTKPPGAGTGLGLSIVHRIVSEIGGRVEVDSVHNEGTLFRVLLPAAEAQ